MTYQPAKTLPAEMANCKTISSTSAAETYAIMDIPNVVINVGLQAHTSDIHFHIDRNIASVTYLRQWNYPGGRQKSTDECDFSD